MSKLFIFIDFLITCAVSNIPLLFMSGFGAFKSILLTLVLLVAFIIMNIFPGYYKIRSSRYKAMAGGNALLISFLFSVTFEAAYFIAKMVAGELEVWQYIVWGIVIFLTCLIVFWNGIIRVYVTSRQLMLRYRVLGIIFGMVPIMNLIFLFIILKKTCCEVKFEENHDKIEFSRMGQNICRTRYPVLLVHGVFFRDRSIFNYWGRIPEALKLNGAVIYYGGQQSALSVKDSAAEVAQRIKEIIEETGCEKINIIAHSKGGLDCRYALSQLDCGKYVASLTTINSPHRGCIFVDSIFEAMSSESQENLASVYNKASKIVGDSTPDFLSAVGDLRKSVCDRLNEEAPDCPDVFYQSVGSVTRNARSGRFPMDISYPFVKKYDGENDGLVSVESMKWGEKFHFIKVNGNRGVTHADVIDLNRENIEGFDVREYFVQLVAELKNTGF